MDRALDNVMFLDYFRYMHNNEAKEYIVLKNSTERKTYYLT